MDASDPIAQIDALVAALKAASWKQREGIKESLVAVATAHPTDAVQRHLEAARKGLNDLELRWEIDEVIERMKPPPAPEPEPEPELIEPEPETPGRQLRMSDLVEVYADPRGLVLFTDKKGKRWFASQPHPMTGQPMMMELGPAEITQVRQQLAGSPYWNVGSGLAG
jgi:hypothetical protein